MSISSYKRLTIALSIACLGLCVLSGVLFLKHGMLSVRVALATEQIKIFSDMRQKTLESSDVNNAANCLQYAVGYYPSGTKQVSGSRLDRMVEQERSLVIKDIVAYLRAKTGQDLGDNPEAWIQRYSKQ